MPVLVRSLAVFVLGGLVSGCLSHHSGQPTSLASLHPVAAPSSAGALARTPRTNVSPNSSAATWQMPWQITPIAYGSAKHRERIAEAVVPGTGRVRGTPMALQSIGRPLVSAEGKNRTVASCRNKVSQEARKFGAKEVEVVSAGPESFRDGVFSGPVRVRITYAYRGKYEVRQSILTCVSSPAGNIVDAYVAKNNRANT